MVLDVENIIVYDCSVNGDRLVLGLFNDAFFSCIAYS
jgi:hypothetical protein